MTTSVLLGLEDGETVIRQERRDILILAERPELSITWSRYSPGERGPELHVHREHTDAFYVLEGELTFLLGPAAQPSVVGAGGFVAAPPNVVHTFVNESDADAQWLNFHAPDKGFAAYLRGLYGGPETPFDSFDPPADGGLPLSEAILAGPHEGVKADRPELWVADGGDMGPPSGPTAYRFAHGARAVEIHAPERG